MFDFDNRGEALVLEGVGQRVVDFFIESFYYQAEVGKQPERVFLVLEIYLSEVEHVRKECLWFETLISEFLFMSYDYFKSLFVIIVTGGLYEAFTCTFTFFVIIVTLALGALDMLCITDLDAYWLLF